jgi:hypothetical protein
MKTYYATSDSSGIYRERSGDFGPWTAGTAEAAPTIDLTKNNSVPSHQIYLVNATPSVDLVYAPTVFAVQEEQK